MQSRRRAHASASSALSGAAPELIQVSVETSCSVDERVLGQREDDRRDEVGLGDPVALDELEEAREVEARHGHDGRAGAQGLVHDHGHAVDVEERQGPDDRVALADVLDLADLAEVRDDVAVGEHHALRQARRAARVGQRDEVVGVGLVRHRRVAAGQQVVERRLTHHEDVLRPGLAHALLEPGRRDREAGVGVLELEADLVGGVGRVDRRHDPAERRDGVEGDGVFRPVRRAQGEHVAAAEAAVREAGGERPDGAREVAVGERAPRRAVDQGRAVAALGRVLEDEGRQGHVGHGDVAERALEDHAFNVPRRSRGARAPAPCAGGRASRSRPRSRTGRT